MGQQLRGIPELQIFLSVTGVCNMFGGVCSGAAWLLRVPSSGGRRMVGLGDLCHGDHGTCRPVCIGDYRASPLSYTPDFGQPDHHRAAQRHSCGPVQPRDMPKHQDGLGRQPGRLVYTLRLGGIA